MKNEIAIKEVIDYFIENNEINFAETNLDETSIDYYPVIEELVNSKWGYKLLTVSNISFQYYGGTFGDFSDFPEQLFLFKNLESINFTDNNFETISDSILKLKRLNHISFSNNKLKTFPEIITKHPTLQSVGLLGNPFVAYNFLYEYSNETRFETIKEKLIDYYNNNPQEYFEFYSFSCGVCLKRLEINIYIYNEADFYINTGHEKKNGISLIVENKNSNSLINQSKIYKEFKEVFEMECLLNYIDIKQYINKNNLNWGAVGKDTYNWFSLNKLIELRKEEKEIYELNDSNISLYTTDLIKQIGGKELLEEIEVEITKKKKETSPKFNYISQLKIYNFKLFEQIEITEISPSINVAIGLNGAGKTTLLQAIALGFLNPQSNSIFFTNYFFNRRIENSKHLPDAEKYCGIVFNQTYDKRFFRNRLPEINKAINRNCIFLAYGVNLFNKENIDHKSFAEKIFEGVELQVFVDSIFSDYSSEFYNPLRILDELLYIERTSEATKEQKKERKTIRDTLNDSLNQFLDLDEIGKCQINQTLHKYSFVNKTGAWSLAELSEGYRANTLLISDILIRILASRKKIFGEQKIDIKNIFAETQGYILIDEFDRHLHPVWQRRFLSKLKEILPKIQFFVTTHNVFALQSAVGENIIQLRNEPKTNYVCEKISNGSILAITRKYFTNNLFDYKTQKDLDKFSETLSKIYNEEIETDFVYSQEFKVMVQKLYNISGEIQTMLASQLLQLNSTLKQLNKKEFEL